MTDTKTDKRPSIRVSVESHSKIEANRGKQSQGEFISSLFAAVDELRAKVDELSAVTEQKSALDFKLDAEKKMKPFGHLGGKKLKNQPHYEKLVDKYYTEQELVDEAIVLSGKSKSELVKDALISQAKEEITRATKRKYEEEKGIAKSPVGEKLYKALAALTQQQEAGTLKVKFGRINISRVAKEAGVDYKTAVKWAEGNQPELLETGRLPSQSDDSNVKYDLEATA